MLPTFRAGWRLVTGDVHKWTPRIKTPSSTSAGVCLDRLGKQENSPGLSVIIATLHRSIHMISHQIIWLLTILYEGLALCSLLSPTVTIITGPTELTAAIDVGSNRL